MNIRNIGIFAHVDGGKTTTTEQMLYISGKTRTLGSVDKGSAITDYNDIEKRRGITIFSEEASFEFKNTIINLIDTPGHLDFYSEVKKSILAIDGAILIVPALEGVYGNTERLWSLLRENNIPTIIFLNKIDRVGVNIEESLNSIRENLTNDFIEINSDFFSEENLENLIEILSLKDDEVLNKYLECETLNLEYLKDKFITLCKIGKIFPLFKGASIDGSGVTELIEGIIDFLPNPFESIKNKFLKDSLKNKSYTDIDSFNCDFKKLLLEDYSYLDEKVCTDNYPLILVYKLKHDEELLKLTYVKVLKGELKPRHGFKFEEEEEKISSIRKYTGEKFESVNSLKEGEVGVLCGLKSPKVGDILGLDSKINLSSKDKAFLTSKISLENEEEYNELLKALNILKQEDPNLEPIFNAEMREITINVRGEIHREILKEIFLNRFNLEINLEKPKVTFLETIENESKGFCHYEPKKHYGEVELQISPREEGSGCTFESRLNVDELPLQFQNIIEKTMDEALKHGILLGGRVTDIKVELISGTYDLEHTHGGDFRIATIRALQKALENNKCKLLEPLYKFKIIAPSEFLGKILSDILKMKGTFEDPIISEDKVEIIGELPIQTSMDYGSQLSSVTSGKAYISLSFSRYVTCHNENEVLLDENNKIHKDEALYNSISLFRENRKMKKVY